MLGVGWTEMLVIGVVALIVIGPRDLPVVMRRIGQFAGQIRRMGSDFQRELNKTTGLDEVRSLRNSITAPLKQTAAELRKEFNAITPTGTQPTGVLKPADPAVESVVDEIHAAAGMKTPTTRAEALASTSAAATAASAPAVSTLAPAEAAPPAVKKAPVKAPAKLKPVADSIVSSAELTPVEPVAETPKPAAKKLVGRKIATSEPSPAPIEAVAPMAKKAPARKAATPKPAAVAETPTEDVTAAKPARVRKTPAKAGKTE